MKVALGTKLVLIIEAVIILVSTLGALVTFSIVDRLLLERAQAQLESISVLKEHGIEGYLEEIFSEVGHIARGDYAREQFRRFLKEKKAEDKTEIISIFRDILREKESMSEIIIADNSGVVIVSTNSESEGKIMPDEQFFLDAKERTVVQSFYYDVSAGQTEMMGAAPIRDGSGNFLGILVEKFNVGDISRLMVERSGLGKTGETYIVNSLNLVVTGLLKEPGVALKKTLYSPQITECLRGDSSFFEGKDYHGDEVFGYYHWLPEMQSCLVTEIDQAETLEPIRELAITFLWGTMLLGLLVGLLGYVAGRVIIRPLHKLREAALKIKEGDFNVTADVHSRDEIGDTAMVFNDMASKLKLLYGKLEDEVRKKTIELSAKVKELAGTNLSLEENEKAVLNLLEDIEHEKKKVEETVVERTRELQEEKARLLASINSLHFGFAIVDMGHEIILRNTAMTKLLGVGDKDSVSINDVSRIIGGRIDFRKEVEQCIWSGTMREIKDILFGKIFLRGIIAPVVVGKGSAGAIGYIFLLEDVTEAKVMERSRDEFFAVASHELRTPLTAIRGNTEMILDMFREKITDPEVREMLADIDTSSIRLIKIVNDFLEVSRLEQGKAGVKTELFNISDVIIKVVRDLQGVVSEKNVVLYYVKQDASLPKVSADINRTEQILINLISNALKFTSSGSITVEVKKEDSRLKVAVQDTGIGISEQNQPLLFRKFQQAGEKVLSRDVSKGTGLGLYISKLLAEGMGGTIELEESALGKGSTFCFSLPTASE